MLWSRRVTRCACGFWSLLRLLIPVTSIEADSSPVNIAAANGWEDVMGLLIKLGIDSNLKAGQHGSAPLALAIT